MIGRKVSVIIPCYNCEEFLDQALRSLSHQTFTNFEVICINDGSKDSTLAILEKWKQLDAFDLKIVNQNNRGVSAARNEGIRQSRGEFITFLDSDDVYSKCYLQVLVGAVEGSGCDTAFCKLNRNLSLLDESADIDNQRIVSQYDLMDINMSNMGEHGFYCFIYRKKIIDDNDILFDETTKHFEDREFNWKYMANCENGVSISNYLYGYRMNDKSVLHKKGTYYTDSLDAIHRVENYLFEKDCEYYPILKSYLYPRGMWSLAKTLAVNGNYSYIKRLIEETDVKICMKKMIKDKDLKVRFSSYIFLFHPCLFYILMKLGSAIGYA